MTSLRTSFDPPSPSALNAYVRAAEVARRPHNHDFVPGGRAEPEDLRVIAMSTRVGSGQLCYIAACRRLRAWRMHDGSAHTGIFAASDGSIVTWARMAPALWVLNPCRAVKPAPHIAFGSSKAVRRSDAVAYATTEGHLIQGVEHMRVTLSSPRDGSVVDFHVHSASRGSGLLGRALFPLLAPAQRRYFHEQLRCMAVGCAQ